MRLTTVATIVWAMPFTGPAASAAIPPPVLDATPPASAVPDLRLQEAQGQEPAEDTGEGADTTVAPISASGFAEAEARANLLLREIEGDLVSDPETQEIFEDLQELTATLDRLLDMPEAVNPDRYPLRRIESLRSQWFRFESRLSSWQDHLRERVARLDERARDLDRLTARFQATDSALAARNAPDVIRLRIPDLLDGIEAVRERVEGVLAGTLAVQERLLSEQARVADQLALFDERLQTIQEQLWLRDAPPLWSLLAEPRRLIEPTAERGRTFSETVEAIESFAAVNRTRLLLQVALFALIALALIVLRRRLEGTDDGAEVARSSALLEHPIATALIAGLFVTIPLYPAPPVEISELALLISVPAILLLLPGIGWRSVRIPLFFVAGLFALDVVAANLDWIPRLGRSLLFLETVLALAGAVWFLRPSSAAHELSAGRWWRATLVGVRLAAVVLLVSALANLVGNRSLAEFLTQAVVRAGYAAVAFYTGSIVATGLVSLVVRTRASESVRILKDHKALVVKRIANGVHLVAFLGWVWTALRLFSLWEPLVGWMGDVRALEITIGSYAFTVGAIALFIVAVWLAFKASQLIRFVLEGEVLERLDLPKGIPSTISTLTHWTILGVGLLLAAGAAGIDFTRITIVAGALGVGIGFGLQNLVNNFVSGLILVFERPIAVGDWVDVGTLAGQVKRIGMRSSTVRTLDGAEVIVPNGNLIQSEVTNWTLTDRRRRIQVPVGVAYGTDPETVLALLRGVGERHPEVLAFPEPDALFLGFGDSSLDFALRAWTSTFEDHIRVRSELTVQVHDAIVAADIVIPFPQRDLHVKSVAVQARQLMEDSTGESADPSKARSEIAGSD